MALKAVYDKLEDIPEKFQELYTERNGKFELTGIEGVKTPEDVARVQTALEKERREHGETKDKLKAYGDLDPEGVQKDLDELAELRIRIEGVEKGGIDDEKLDRLVAQRVAREKAPIERERDNLRRENETLTAQNSELQGTIKTGRIETEIRKQAEAATRASTRNAPK